MQTSDILRGMHQLVNPQNVKDGVDYEEIERMYLGGERKEEKENNPTEAFRDELKALANKLELSFDTPAATNRKNQTPVFRPSPRPAPQVSFDFSTPARNTPRRTPAYNTPIREEQSEEDAAPRVDSSWSARSPRSDEDKVWSARSPRVDSSWPTETPQHSSYDDYETPRNKEPTELEKRTNEQIRHDQIKGVMDEMGAQNTTIFTLEQTRRQDEKLTMLDEIASLKMSLEEDEAKGIENIPRVDNKSSYEDVESVLKSYRLINDRMRYCSLADEFILWGAQGMEELFNGKRTWFGRYNPDLSGWSKQVSVKLRRMRHETSQLVGGIMHDYNIGPGMRIILELIPNMFMYARTKKQNYGKPNLMSDSEISRAISDIRNTF